MKNRLFYLLLVLCITLLTSCVTTRFESGLQRIELGMTKQQVIHNLGNSYIIMGAVNTPDGIIETWKYSDPNLLESPNKRIIVNFLNDRLDEWHRDYIPTGSSNTGFNNTVSNNNKDSK